MAMDMNGDRMGYATDNMIHLGVFQKVSRILQRNEISLSIEHMLIIHEILALPSQIFGQRHIMVSPKYPQQGVYFEWWKRIGLCLVLI